MIIQTSAVEKIREIMSQESQPTNLRVFVQGGGCSGFQYGFTFDEQQNEDDFDFEYNGVKIVVDSISMQYLQGSEIQYQDNDMGSSFVIKNPNAVTTCGCGSSFSVG